MKIVDLVAHVLSTPLEEPFAFSQGRVRRRSAVVVEVVTDEGVTGWASPSATGCNHPRARALRPTGILALRPQDPTRTRYGSRQGHHPGRSLALLRLRQLGDAQVAREADEGQ